MNQTIKEYSLIVAGSGTLVGLSMLYRHRRGGDITFKINDENIKVTDANAFGVGFALGAFIPIIILPLYALL
jgi:hypothetical protein